MSETKNVWIFIEQDEGKIIDVSLELMSKGRELADTLGSELWAVAGRPRSRESLPRA
jgi:electron transfer flavoprotein alpha subunit